MFFRSKILAQKLLHWYERHGRIFSFRKASTPYEVLIAEIMLRKTTARQVNKVWPEFVKRFPTIEALSKADEREVERLIAPLGIKKRAHDLVMIAKAIVKYYGKFPHDVKELIKLPGVGEYVANCVACFCFGKKLPLVDSNVRRVLTRLFGTELRGLRGRELDEKINRGYLELMPSNNIRKFHYAMLDLAALICKPKNPKCDYCPLKTWCSYSKLKV